MKNQFHLLDCTFRDGGYYNDWRFSPTLFKKYISYIKKNKINFIEVGFRFSNNNQILGKFAFTDDKFLKRFKFPKDVNIAIMINCSDFINKKIEKFFINKKQSLVSIVRIASHLDEIDYAISFSRKLKKLGYKVFINIMQIDNTNKSQLIDILKKLKKNYKYIAKLYFADSFGNLNPKKTKELCKVFNKHWGNDFGVHMHNNKGKALINSLCAIKNGAKYVDSTILGMGRGAGNTKTEEILKYFINKFQENSLNKSIYTKFQKLKKLYNWGPSKLYSYAAEKNIHPTYVQNIISDERYNIQEKNLVIKNLSNQNVRRFDPELLNNAYNKIKKKGKTIKKILNHNLFFEKEILIIGQSNKIKEKLNFLKQYINKNKPTVICLNYNRNVPQELIDYYIISNEQRAILDKKHYKIIHKPVITTKSIYNNFLDNDNKIYIYDLNIKENMIKINKKRVTLFDNHVFGYTLSFLISRKIFNFKIFGIDINKVNKKDHYRMSKILLRFKSKYKKIYFKSILQSSINFNG